MEYLVGPRYRVVIGIAVRVLRYPYNRTVR